MKCFKNHWLNQVSASAFISNNYTLYIVQKPHSTVHNTLVHILHLSLFCTKTRLQTVHQDKQWISLLGVCEVYMVAGGALIDTRSHLSPYELHRYFLSASYEKAMTKIEDWRHSIKCHFSSQWDNEILTFDHHQTNIR